MTRQVLTTIQQLDKMAEWVRTEQPFLYVRLNDTEATAMFDTHDGEHIPWYKTDKYDWKVLGIELKKAVEDLAVDRRENTLVGYYGLDPIFTSHPGVIDFERWLAETGYDFNWANGCLWYTNPTDPPAFENIKALVDALRNSSRPVALVGNIGIVNAVHCLESEFVLLATKNTWIHREEILTNCRGLAKDNAVFVWCGGIPAKIWMCNLFKEFPQSSHIDAGCTFDGAFGDICRQWMEDPENKHHKEYFGKFVPYVKSFIPA